ncbi:ATP-binding protein [Streptomyces sp. NBC_00859]|uniref:ATP-binding protein n=1 Tax=Streptomyces sp. NBC_00859 TaxID=2903682 RepID=UPI00386AC0A6|nr:ATP-binding protein [Streptomyces sp. NBC_00859]
MTLPAAQMPRSGRTFTQRFSATRRGARLARRLAAHQLDTWDVPYGSPVSESVALIVAELAANAALHGRVPGRDFALRLTYGAGTGVIRVEVSDTHPGLPVRLHPAGDADGGRGLILVEAVAARWGVRERMGPGKTVFAEVEGEAASEPG